MNGRRTRWSASTSALGSDISRARSFRRRFFVEADALTFVELLELAGRDRAAMEEPFLTAIIADEAESAIPDQPFNRAIRHVDVPPRAIDRRPCVGAIKLRSSRHRASRHDEPGVRYLKSRRQADSGLSSPVAG